MIGRREFKMLEIDYSPEIISWLQIVLTERFCLPIKLQAGRESVRLGIDGAEKCIEIDLLPAFYQSDFAELPFTSWDAVSDGWNSVMGPPLPAPGASVLPKPLVVATDMGYRIRYDLLGLTYWMLSRAEEVNSSAKDRHGRFPANASHAFKYDYLERPIVDEWLCVLKQIMMLVWPDIKIGVSEFSIKLSHDVDHPSRYAFSSMTGMLRAMAADILKYRDIRGAICGPWIRIRSKERLHPIDPLNNFDWIMDISERNNLRSSFYFICGRTDSARDTDYEIEDRQIRRLIQDITARGHEIGLHPSYNSFESEDVIYAEAQRLRRLLAAEGIQQDVQGGRMHYLRWKHPVTLRAWESAGLKYDSTLGYADRPGFRCGTCFEYPAFDPEQKRVLKIRIRPLIVMECTVIADSYLGLGEGRGALQKFLQLKDACRKVSGCFTLLWHNSQLDSVSLRQLYENVVVA